MPQDRLKVIPGPDGRVALTTAPFRDGDLEEVLLQLPQEDVETQSRVVLLGDPKRDPISSFWPLPFTLFATCLPGAFERVLVEFPQPMPELQSVPSLRTYFDEMNLNHVFVRQADSAAIADAFEFLPALVPRHLTADDSLRDTINKVASRVHPATPACAAFEAGLLLMNDCLDESHSCSQSIEGEGQYRSGDYWHAIMHRREPDFGNAKYWFRQVGRHPAFKRLSKSASAVISRRETSELQSLTTKDWNPFLFVDLCEKYAHDEGSPNALALREIQGWEMRHLLSLTGMDAAC